jgi:hypothetical protein
VSEIGDVLLPALNRFRAQLRRDAVRHGWLRRWHTDKRTPAVSSCSLRFTASAGSCGHSRPQVTRGHSRFLRPTP